MSIRMEDEVGGPLISTHFLDVSSHITPLGNGSLLSDLSSTTRPTTNDELKSGTETSTEANDVLRNGILIETSKGLEWLSLTEALASGVGGLNLSVEDFQNVAAQLLHSQPAVIVEPGESSSNPCISSIKEEKQTTSTQDGNQPVCYGLINSTLESIAETAEHCDDGKIEMLQPIIVPKGMSICLRNINVFEKQIRFLKSSDSSLTVSESTGTNSDSSVQSVPQIQVKRKGGWPKGRKRKPEVTNRPPKAPCTGYVYYLNEKRKRPEFRNVPFPEVTKILGNEWTNLSLENKKDYLERAELDKKRYREELKIYRNSETYRSYLKRRRIKSCKSNATEESDIDATDEIDDEDNEELYCRACDQWFYNLHNKKEHLYGKQHFQTISHNANRPLSSDESSLDKRSSTSLSCISDLPSVTDAMSNVFQHIAEREQEIITLQERMKILVEKNKQILKELQDLKQSEGSLQKLACIKREEAFKIEKAICDLWDVPAFFNTEEEL